MLKFIMQKIGFQPEIRRELAIRDKAMSGDMKLVCSPAALGSSAAVVNAAIAGSAGVFKRAVVVSLKTLEGDIHDWYDGPVAGGIGGLAFSVAHTSARGTVAIDASSPSTLTAGQAVITLDYTGTWAEGDTARLVVIPSLHGIQFGNHEAVSVDTLIA
jgi:hypothetical protein